MANKNSTKDIEATILTEELLQNAIEKTIDTDTEPVPKHNEVTELCLQNENISMIDNLWSMTSLTVLDLKNNLIEKISGLNCLVNLKWLDLSFNNINKMEGLEPLEQLEVLNLSDNKISVIENMDTLKKLTHFSFENNLLEKMDLVLPLRKCKFLFDVNLSGNPITKEENYRLYVTACFSEVKFLDQRLLDENVKKEGMIKYLYLVEKLKAEEKLEEEKLENQQKEDAKLQLHKDAFVEYLDGSHMLDSMCADDPEVEILHHHPGIASLFKIFEKDMLDQCEQLLTLGLSELELRQTELNSFYKEQSDLFDDFHQRGSQINQTFEKEQRKRIEEVQQLYDPQLVESKIKQCNDEIDLLGNSFMALEFKRMSLNEEIISKLEPKFAEMVTNFSETALGIFSQFRAVEDDYFLKAHEVAKETELEISTETLEQDLPDDVMTLFTDVQDVVNAMAAAHDNHVARIIDRETEFTTRISAWLTALMKKIKEKQLLLHRLQLSDIQKYKDYLKEGLLNIQ